MTPLHTRFTRTDTLLPYPTLFRSGPFEPWTDGDKLYGRGAGDMKAGIVAYTMALKALQKLGYEPEAKVVLQSVVEEECTGIGALARSEEQTSELQSLMRISYAVFCLKKKNDQSIYVASPSTT